MKAILVDEQPNHPIMKLLSFREAEGLACQAFNAGPQKEIFILDCLGILLANDVLF